MTLTGRWKFAPRFWPTLATVLAIPALVGLGQWQLGRAAEKERSYAHFLQRRAEPVRHIEAGEAEVWQFQAMKFRTIRVRGRYDVGMNLLLDNQVHDGVAGYWVYTPLALEGVESYILINRGWVPAGNDRRIPPAIATPPGVVTLSGMASLPPSPGVALGEDAPEKFAPGFVRLQTLEMERMLLEYGGKLLPYELRLDPGVDSGFVRDWKAPGSGSERHRGYAFQWFAMAAAAAVLYVLLNWRRTVEAT